MSSPLLEFEVTAGILEIVAKVAGIGGIGLTLVMLLIRNVIQENILRALPLAQRKSIVWNIILGTFITSVIAIGAWVFIESKKLDNEGKKIDTGARIEEKKLSFLDTVEMRKTKNFFSVKEIDLEGNAISTLLDSSKLSAAWVSWFKGNPVILTGASVVFDTLKALYKSFAYSPERYRIPDGEKIIETISKNGRRIKAQAVKAPVRLIYSEDPNATTEFAFQVDLNSAINIFGFKRSCFLRKGKNRPGSSGYDISQCSQYLNINGLDWLLDHYVYNPQQLYGEWLGGLRVSDLYATDQYLRFYSRICKRYIPDNFILLSSGIIYDCFQSSDKYIKLAYSTPRLKLGIIAIKNESQETINLDRLKFGVSFSDSLRVREDDLKTPKARRVFDNGIKLSPGQVLIIPSNIKFTPTRWVKGVNETWKPEQDKDKEPYIYASAYYLDSLKVNGYDFPINSQKKAELIQAFYDGVAMLAEGSCPYLYFLEAAGSRYRLEDHILYKRKGKAQEGYDTLLLEHPSQYFIIHEADEEISHLDQVYILEKSSTGYKKYFPENKLLQEPDQKYVTLKYKGNLAVPFKNLKVDTTHQYFLVSRGYYAPFGKAHKPARYLK